MGEARVLGWMALTATVRTLRTQSWAGMAGVGLGDGEFRAKKSKDLRLEFDRQMAGFRWEMAGWCGAELQGSGAFRAKPDGPSRLMDRIGDGRGWGEGGWIPKGDAIPEKGTPALRG